MSLIDLTSDLSKFRSEVSREDKMTPESSKAKDGKNFATLQPITSKLAEMSPDISAPKQTDLASMLDQTKFDDTKPFKTTSLANKLSSTKLDDTKAFNTKPIESRLSSTKLDDTKAFNTTPIENRLSSTKLDDTKTLNTPPIESYLETTKLDDIRPFRTQPIENYLESSNFDDIVKTVIENGLVNSVSKYSNINKSFTDLSFSRISIEQIASKFGEIRQERFVSMLNKSEITIERKNVGTNNNESETDPELLPLTSGLEVSSPELVVNPNDASDNIQNPNITIERKPLSINREEESPSLTIKPNDSTDNIENPNILIIRKPLFSDLSPQSVVINSDLISPINNVVDPNISLERSELFFDRTNQSVEVITDLPIDGVVTIPETKILRLDLSSRMLNDTSDLNVDDEPLRYVPISRLMEMTPSQIVEAVRYDLQSMQLGDNSIFNIDDVQRTNPSGRHEDTSTSKFSLIGTQEVNFFQNNNASGFTVNQQIGDTKFSGNSVFGWNGKQSAAPAVSFMVDNNATGFTTFAQPNVSEYVPNSSKFTFVNIPQTDFFDQNSKFTTSGFTTFAVPYETAYKPDSSIFAWAGKSDSSPEVDYFDIKKSNTTSGFNRFPQLYDSKYIVESSIYDWEGNSASAPETNYFDITNKYTTLGFSRLAQVYDTKYIADSSEFTWKGVGTTAPSVNYFDREGQNTNTGFHTFAQIYDTKYIPEASNYDWDGTRDSAPTTNYFDLTSQNTNAGFHTLAQLYDSKYIPESSIYDWDGTRDNAPAINYFDLTAKNTSAGFHILAQSLETKYIPNSSTFDWDGTRDNAPTVNYFDLTARNTTEGFHKFAQLGITKYVKESSIYDWDGDRSQAPAVNYLDLLKQYTTEGFNTFTQFLITKYIPQSSRFDWDGFRSDAPAVNYFDLTGKHTTIGFHTFARKYESKYIEESSEFDWDGKRNAAPAVNYFDLTGRHSTIGFHTFAQIYDTKYIPEASIFDWDGSRSESPEVNYFDLTGKFTTIGFHRLAQKYDTKYIKESSEFDWDGSPSSSPEVNYFDLPGKFTTKGFHRQAVKLDTKYIKESSEFDWDGGPGSAPEVNYFDLSGKFTTVGFHRKAEKLDTKYIPDSSEFDWDGGREAANTVDFFGNESAPGFTKFPKALESEYKKDISKFTFKGSQPTPINYFPDSFNSGFTLKAPKLASEYIEDISEFTWKGGRSEAASVNFITDTQGGGFTTFAVPLQTEYTSDISEFTFKGARSNAPNVDYLINQNAPGFGLFPPLLETKYNTESSLFAWKGGRSDAPNVNYITDDAGQGFTTLTGLYQSFYTPDFGDYNWKGGRSQAPNVKYFGIGPIVRNTIPNPNDVSRSTMADAGFVTFFDNKANTQLSSGYSSLSTESGPNKSPVNNKPATNFFGFTPFEKRGFMVKMNSFAETLYPVIKPELTYNAEPGFRTNIETTRSTSGITISGRDQFAPNAFGKKGWTSGGVLASLTNQVPESKVNAEPSYYGNPYAKTMKDVTESKGYLAKWAITKRSPSPLDQQYTKYNLRDDSYNKDFGFDQPYVLRDIGQRWGFGVGFDEGLVRGGAVTAAERIVQDVFRIGKFLLSAKGLLFVAKQVGLQLMNPSVDVDPESTDIIGSLTGIPSTQVYNPVAMIANVGGSPIGLRLPRHSLLGAIDEGSLNKYERATKNREYKSWPDPTSDIWKSLEAPSGDGDQTDYNRLIGLMKELLPSSFKPITNETADLSTTPNIGRISSNFGGPNAPLGIGGTTIRKASHPHLTYYTTSPVLPESDITQSSAPPQSGSAPSTGAPTNPPPTTGGAAGGSSPSGGPSTTTPTNTYNAPAWSITSNKNKKYPLTARRNQYYSTLDDSGDNKNNYAQEIIDDYIATDKRVFGAIRKLSDILNSGPVEENTSQSSTLPSPIKLQNASIQKIKQIDPYNPSRRTIVDRVRSTDFVNAIVSILPNEQLNQSSPDELNPLRKYLTATYSNLKKTDASVPNRSRKYNDFRWEVYEGGSARTITGSNGEVTTVPDTADKEYFVSDPKLAKYHSRNLETYFGLGAHGEPGSQRNIPAVTNILYVKDSKTGASSPRLKPGRQFRGDRINIIDYKKVKQNITTDLVYERGKYKNEALPGANDLVEFYFTGLKIQAGGVNRPAEIIAFRATFNSITDSHNPKWNSVKYMGRGDPLYVYDGYDRGINFGFTVHIGSRDEMKASWRKLNFLASWTAPEYTKSGLIRGPMIRLNIGHLYRKMPGFINSLSYSFDNVGTTWETAHLEGDRKQNVKAGNLNLSNPGVLQLPKTVEVSVGFTPVGVYRPEYNGVMYSLYDDSNSSIETGLMPKETNRVNYFRAFDSNEDLATVPELDNEQIASPLPGNETEIPQVTETLREDTNKDEKDSGFASKEEVKTATDATQQGSGAGSNVPEGQQATGTTQTTPAGTATPADTNASTTTQTGPQAQPADQPNVPDPNNATPAATPAADPATGATTSTDPVAGSTPATSSPTSADWSTWAQTPSTPSNPAANTGATTDSGTVGNTPSGATPATTSRKKRRRR
jgi:hypothetical protein